MRLSILTNHGATDGDVADMDAARAIIDWELGRDGVTGATITVGADAEAPTGVVESWPFAEVVATPASPRATSSLSPICRRVEPFRTGGVMPRPEDG